MVEIQDSNGVFVTKDRLLRVTRDIKKRFGQVTGEMHVQLVLNELAGETETHSRAYYRALATSSVTGGKKRLITQKSNSKLNASNMMALTRPLKELNLRLVQPIGMKLKFEGSPPKMACTVEELDPEDQSQAAANGLRVGDEVNFLNGICTKKMTPVSVNRLLSQNLVFLGATRPNSGEGGEEEKMDSARVQFNAPEYVSVRTRVCSLGSWPRHTALRLDSTSHTVLITPYILVLGIPIYSLYIAYIHAHRIHACRNTLTTLATSMPTFILHAYTGLHGKRWQRRDHSCA
jgi:hypothetical protein